MTIASKNMCLYIYIYEYEIVVDFVLRLLFSSYSVFFVHASIQKWFKLIVRIEVNLLFFQLNWREKERERERKTKIKIKRERVTKHD